MTEYTDYEFYINNYSGNIALEDFEKLSIKASKEVQNRIMNRDISGFEEEVRNGYLLCY